MAFLSLVTRMSGYGHQYMAQCNNPGNSYGYQGGSYYDPVFSNQPRLVQVNRIILK